MKKLKRIAMTFLISLILAGAFCTSAMAAPRLSASEIVLVKGQTKTLKVKGTKEKVKWSSNKKKIATVNSKGLVHAKRAGKAVITAKIGKKKITCKVKVENTVISNAKIQLKVGKTRPLSIKNCSQKVKWKASSKTIEIKRINEYEVYVTAKKRGVATVTAIVGGKKFTCKVTVIKLAAGNSYDDKGSNNNKDDDPVDDTGKTAVEFIRLNKDSAELTVGNTCTLTAKVFPLNAADKSVTWSSSDKSVASVANGIVTAVSPGTAVIAAKAGNCQVSCTVQVSEVKVSSVKLNKTSEDIIVGDSFVLEVTVSPSNAADKTITWSSDKPEVATVDSDGKVIGISDGIARITARAGDCAASCRVKVDEIDISSVKLNVTNKKIVVGDSFVLEATVFPDNATNKTVTWSSNAPEVATVDSNGRVVGVSSGMTEIKVKAGNKDAICQVRVDEPDYNCGEEWKVEGQWGFKVNSVSTHYLCNSVSDKTGAQVVIIDYTYYQYGYYGSLIDLYFSSMDMDVTDGKGAAASTYPCTHEKDSKELHNVGEYCNASQAFVLENKSETISLTVSKYTSDTRKEKRARFVLPVKVLDSGGGKEILKSYILTHGATNVNGNCFIESSYQNDKFGIAYNSSAEEFRFVLTSDNGQIESALEMVVPEKSIELLTANYVLTYSSSVGSGGLEAKTTIDPRIYASDTDVVFTIESSTLTDPGQLAEGSELANTHLKLAFTGWSELLLKSKVGISMSDIGFLVYE